MPKIRLLPPLRHYAILLMPPLPLRYVDDDAIIYQLIAAADADAAAISHAALHTPR